MSKLTNMKVDRAARDAAMKGPATISDEGPLYPWGLGIQLENESIELLGMKTLPEAGETMLLVAKVKVTGTTSEDVDGEGGKRKRQSVRLQITDMALEDGGAKTNAAEKLYAE
jgi:hypothetical protein